MHSGFNLVSGIIRAFGDCPHLGAFLDGRLKTSPHLSTKSLERRAIKESLRKQSEANDYGTMIA